MAKHNTIGKLGEQLAVDYFIQKDYQILNVNWRYSYYEIDIIASKNSIIHFIEVKTKSTNKNGYPEMEVTRKKLMNLIEAAEQYLFKHPQWNRIQFDILSITLYPEIEYFLIEDVYL